jgi:hypothetical protein
MRVTASSPVGRWLGLVFALALVALTAGSASADTMIGQTGAGGNCGRSPDVLGDTHYVVPSGGGTITSFSFQSTSNNAGQRVDFMVLRPVSGSSYTVVGNTGVVTLAGTGSEPETFAADISVLAGDILGLWEAGSLKNCGFSAGSGGGFVFSASGPDPNTGDSVSLEFPTASADLNESANLVTRPTTKAQCKHGGWRNFGSTFKNQGDCVSFVATGGQNPPSGSRLPTNKAARGAGDTGGRSLRRSPDNGCVRSRTCRARAAGP